MTIKINNKEKRNENCKNLLSGIVDLDDMSTVELFKLLYVKTKSGDYQPNWKRIAAIMLIAIFYVVLPYDLIPEAFLSVFGFADDLAVISFLIKKMIKYELCDFKKWLKENNIAFDQYAELN